MEIAETDTSFLAFGVWDRTLVCIVPQFVAVITRDLAWVLLLSSSFLVSDLGPVDSGGRGVSRFPGIPLVSMLLLLFILFTLIGRLRILGRSGCGSGSGTFRSLGVIPAIYRPFHLDFMGGGMGRSTSLEIAQISRSHVGTRA